MAYSEKVIDHYSNPKNVGTLDKSKANVGTGLVGAPECGDVMRLQIEVDDTTGVITDEESYAANQSIVSPGNSLKWEFTSKAIFAISRIASFVNTNSTCSAFNISTC